MIFIVIHGDQALKSGQERLQERECDASGQFHCLAWENFLRPPSQTFLQHRLKFKIRHHCSSGLNIQIQNIEFSKILAPPSPYSLGLGLELGKKGSNAYTDSVLQSIFWGLQTLCRQKFGSLGLGAQDISRKILTTRGNYILWEYHHGCQKVACREVKDIRR